VQHAFNEHWTVSADYTHEQGNHGYRAYPYPTATVFHSDNRSSYNALMVHVQGNMRRFSLVANYTLSKAETWGCLLGELFDYVNGVCDPLNAFRRGDYGPSGEDVRHRSCARRYSAYSRRFRIEQRSPRSRAPAPLPSRTWTTPTAFT
jgi:hypothetical protein